MQTGSHALYEMCMYNMSRESIRLRSCTGVLLKIGRNTFPEQRISNRRKTSTFNRTRIFYNLRHTISSRNQLMYCMMIF
uniref:Uncharacterized protein n=1 Tax=Anopheles coluzzii TaxID=1518534 RepID=A0A9I3BDB3_ANOCL